jgi:hypothetical protein
VCVERGSGAISIQEYFFITPNPLYTCDIEYKRTQFLCGVRNNKINI